MPSVRLLAVVSCCGCLTKPGPPGGVDANIVFVTSTVIRPSELGTTDPDTICAGLADAAQPGTFVAWIGTSDRAAAIRLGNARGWVRPDGALVADSVGDLMGGRLYHPIRLTETGIDVGSDPANVITGTTQEGMIGNCDDFTDPSGGVYAGRATATSGSWSSVTSQPCDLEGRLYCFGTDKVAQLPVPDDAGRLAFVTGGTYTMTGGLAEADMICNTEATDAHIPGTFAALLATTQASAAARFSTAGAPWVTLDGVRVTSNLRELEAPINVTPGRDYIDGYAWTGAAGTDVQSKGLEGSCGNWTDAVGVYTAEIGRIEDVAHEWFAVTSSSECSVAEHLYCLEL